MGEVERRFHDKGIELKPDFVDAHFVLGNFLWGRGRGGDPSYRKVIELKPDFADAHFVLGNVLKGGEVEEATSVTEGD